MKIRARRPRFTFSSCLSLFNLHLALFGKSARAAHCNNCTYCVSSTVSSWSIQIGFHNRGIAKGSVGTSEVRYGLVYHRHPFAFPDIMTSLKHIARPARLLLTFSSSPCSPTPAPNPVSSPFPMQVSFMWPSIQAFQYMPKEVKREGQKNKGIKE